MYNKLIWRLFLLGSIALLCSSVARADYEAGRAAWKSGRPAEALAQWQAAAKMEDPVEADEAYIGGKRKNMPKSRREAMKGAGSLAGKTIVAGARDRRTNKVSAAVVEGMDGWTLQSFVEDRVIADAKVYTDEHASWLGLIFHDHESVNHSKGEYVRGDAGTQGIESFWAMLKRAHTGTFHKISPKHMDRYVTEFAGRHNDRRADTLDQMGNIVPQGGPSIPAAAQAGGFGDVAGADP